MNFNRVVAVLACGCGVAACSGADLPGFDALTPKPTTTVLTIESSPPGAEARTSLGATCRTPCTLPIASPNDFTVSYALNGYEPQTLTVHSKFPPKSFTSSFSSTAPEIEPNPVFATLQPASPPPKVAKAPPPKRRPSRPPPVAADAAPETQQPQQPPPPPPPPSLGGFAPPPGTFTPVR